MIKVGPIDFRASPFRTFLSKSVLQLLSWVIPETALGRPIMNHITRDRSALAMLNSDKLRWTGGCKVSKIVFKLLYFETVRVHLRISR